ncbi:hypothetical protein [Parasedimentitalea psychrophila]|uniref:Uncharacterized protein n=1 Tax=Parasedimentitalea psychrophila TaxID=2997337 RepID=A0A9Y2L048_9RHOB|nr:hypothetical protein [Parasedimentitalea psychrophila]WIY25107.1 hypothetical protein QPJ95_21890 [Parasedimentitalea psychrophila]
MQALVLRNLPALGLALVLLVAVAWLVNLVQDRTQLQADLVAVKIEVATARVAQQQALDVARFHRAHLARAADQARQFDAIRNDLQEMEGRDAPLSPLLRATAERLWP